MQLWLYSSSRSEKGMSEGRSPVETRSSMGGFGAGPARMKGETLRGCLSASTMSLVLWGSTVSVRCPWWSRTCRRKSAASFPGTKPSLPPSSVDSPVRRMREAAGSGVFCWPMPCGAYWGQAVRWPYSRSLSMPRTSKPWPFTRALASEGFPGGHGGYSC